MQRRERMIESARRASIVGIVATSLWGSGLRAQTTLVTVSGIAYDSLANVPLRDALVSVTGTSRSAISDEKGRFRIDSVPTGPRLFTMQHAAFDSAGLSGVSARVSVQRDMPRVLLAVPSFASLWRAECGTEPAPKDSALVYGTVRDAKTLDAASNVSIDGSWVDLVGGGNSLASIGQRRWRRTASTDARGEYALCGVPVNTALSLRAAMDSSSVALLELEPTALRVRRRDVLVSRVEVAPMKVVGSTDSVVASLPVAPTGTLSGVVTNSQGLPVANAAVAVDTIAEIRSGADGRFVVRDVPIGTRAIAILAIGMKPYSATVDLRAGDTAKLVVPMTSVQTLAEVSVKANTVASSRLRTIEEHRVLGLGTIRDSSEIGKHQSFRTALMTIPGVSIVGKSAYKFKVVANGCPLGMKALIVDGHPSPTEDLGLIDTRDIAVMEVYKRLTPSDIPSKVNNCVIVLWTKFALGK